MYLYRFLVTMLLMVASVSTQAMTVEVVGRQVFATGPVDDDIGKFEEAFQKPDVDTVVLVNSPGGDLWTGLRVGRLIASKGYQTVIAGSCVSACSIMFMGGKERRFSDVFRPNLTFIGIHGAHNKDTKQVNGLFQPQIFAFYKQNMGDKFNASIMNQALYDMEDADSLLRVFDPVRSSKQEPYHCVSGQTPRGKCTKFAGVNASNLGIVTHTDLVKIDLPEKFKTVFSLYGKTVDTVLSDVPAYYADLAVRQCSSDTCKTDVPLLHEKTENRATAVPLEGSGVGSSSDLDTPINAIVRAIYGCNHIKNQPVRLCAAEVVNQYDIRSMVQAAQKDHASAYENLTMPADKFYANEEFGGFGAASSLRTSFLNDITPSKAQDITTVGTQELAQAMRSHQPPVVIDVIAAFKTIPRSVSLLYAGIALEDADKDAALEKRMGGLLALLAPNKTQPVVFFCSSRNSWRSLNASLRAKKLGYTQVQWYRGGLESWNAANLPTASGILQAVAN